MHRFLTSGGPNATCMIPSRSSVIANPPPLLHSVRQPNVSYSTTCNVTPWLGQQHFSKPRRYLRLLYLAHHVLVSTESATTFVTYSLRCISLDDHRHTGATTTLLQEHVCYSKRTLTSSVPHQSLFPPSCLELGAQRNQINYCQEKVCAMACG